jgi:hypothetical protein
MADDCFEVVIEQSSSLRRFIINLANIAYVT